MMFSNSLLQLSHTVLLTGICWIFCCSLAGAQTPKVGFVNSSTVRERFPEYQTAKQRIEAMVADWKKQVDDRQTEIAILEAEMQKKRLIWTDVEVRDKESVLRRKISDKDEFVRKIFNNGGAFDTTAASILRPVETKIAAAIQDVGITEGYDYVWDKSTEPLLYANPRYDLTAKVMDKLGLFTDDIKAKLQEAIDKIDREVNKARQALSPTAIRRRISQTVDDAKKMADDASKTFMKDFEEATKDLKPNASDSTKSDSTKSDSTKSSPQDSTRLTVPRPAPQQDTVKTPKPKN
jgi:outer membrane protein